MDIVFEHEYLDNDEYYSEEEIYSEISDSDDEYENQQQLNPYVPISQRPLIRWTLIKIGKEIFEISSIGRIKPYRSLEQSTEGILLQGTPYRYYRFADKNYFMHELVWQAFNGLPLENFEIKHKPEYTSKYRKIYSNRLHNLTLLPKINIEPLKLDKTA
jgi:hypothetical protein